jgi:hypothetical protein
LGQVEEDLSRAGSREGSRRIDSVVFFWPILPDPYGVWSQVPQITMEKSHHYLKESGDEGRKVTCERLIENSSIAVTESGATTVVCCEGVKW